MDTTLSVIQTRVFDSSPSHPTENDGLPLSGASVTLTDKYGKMYGKTANTDGLAILYIPPGSYCLEASFLDRRFVLDCLETASGMLIDIRIGLILE